MNKLCKFNDSSNIDILAAIDRFLIISGNQTKTRVTVIDTITGNHLEILNSFLTSFYKAKYIPTQNILIIQYYVYDPANDRLLMLKSDKYGIYKILETNTVRQFGYNWQFDDNWVYLTDDFIIELYSYPDNVEREMTPTKLVKVNTLDISALTNNKIHNDVGYREITVRINLIGESMFVVESFLKNNYSVKTVYKINESGTAFYKLFTLLTSFPNYNSIIYPVLDLNSAKVGYTTYIFYIIKMHDPNIFISEKKIDVDIRYLSIDICKQNKNINQHDATYEFNKIQQLLNSKFTKQYIKYDIFNIINTDLIFVETDEQNTNNLVVISYSGDIKYKYDIGLSWTFSHYLYKYICQSNIKYDINDLYELSCWAYNFNTDPKIHKLYIHFNLIKNYLYNSNLLSSYLPNELIALCDTYFYKSYKCIDILPSVKGCNIM